MIEAIPNFSVGKNPDQVEGVLSALKSHPDTLILHVDSGYDANRTVFTLAGTALSLRHSILSAVQYCLKNLTMENHSGEHPRIGMLDVCPLVPLSGSSLQECVQLSRELGDSFAQMGVSGYYYQQSAVFPEKQELAQLRSGGYESIPEKLNLQERTPDFGPVNWNPVMAKMGLCVIGARAFLIAFNINLNTRSIEKARQIASLIRAKGSTESEYRLKGLKAIGWIMESYQCAQVSTNITDIESISLFDVWNQVKKLAEKTGFTTTGSELIGMIPEAALIKAGEQFSSAPDKTNDELIQIAVEQLGLEKLAPFEVEERVLERKLASLLPPS